MSGQSFSASGSLSWSDIRTRMVGGSGSVSLGPKRALLDGIGTSSAVSASDFQGRGPEFANEFGMPPSTWFPGGTGRSRNPFGSTTIPYVAPNTSQVVFASQMASRSRHTVAVRADGRVFAWGAGSFGRLGIGPGGFSRLTPTGVSLGQMGSWNIVSIESGRYHTVGLRADGRVFAWGRGTDGRLGTGNTTNRSTPTGVSGGQMGVGNVVAVSCGRDFTVALRADGPLFAWGRGTDGRLGTGNTTSRNAPSGVSGGQMGVGNVVAVSCGYNHTLALRADGRVFAWGSGGDGRLGTGNTSNRTTPTGVSLGQMGSWNIVSVACGLAHSVVLRADGRVFAWGFGGNGRLGTGNTSNRTTPTGVSLGQMGSWNIVSVAAGTSHTLALRADGRVFAWGFGGNGRMGNGSTSDRTTPTGVSLGQMGSWNVVAVSCGLAHSVAVRADGRLFAWAFGGDGRLGTGNTSNRLTPTGVSLGQMPSLNFF